MKKTFTLLFTILSLSLSAQPKTSLEAIQAQLDELTAQVDSLEKETATQKVKSSAWPSFSGYIQLAYTNNNGYEPLSSFSIKRVRIKLKGNISQDINYTLQLEMASPKIVDAFINYSPLNEIGIKLGQYKIPYSFENTDCSATSQELIEYPLGLRLLSGFSTSYATPSTLGDIGASLVGGFIERDGYNLINYDLGVFNGTGSNNVDTNKSKNIAARLIIKPMKNLQLQASYYRAEDDGTDYDKRNIFSYGAWYTSKCFVFRSEYFAGKTVFPLFLTATDRETMYSQSWYALAGVNIVPNLMAVARYDTFRYDKQDSSTGQTNYTVGLSYQALKYLKIQFNYSYEDYSNTSLTNKDVISLSAIGMF